MESTPNRQDGGVSMSRSGRLLKKSSKLADFQSPDDLDARSKRTSSHKSVKSHHAVHKAEPLDSPMAQTFAAIKSEMFPDADQESPDVSGNTSKESMEVERSYEMPENYQDSAPSKSIYMTEKSTKKKVMKDGRLVLTKAQRKDKALTKGASNAAKTLLRMTHKDSESDKSPPMNTLVKASATPHVYRVNTSHPVDVAAHLKLLGDNLTIIGQRLKEHEGQIAVSGSLSVLLDSLLCSLGPLMCLTVHIPGISDRLDGLKDTLHNTLDNIAYVMPGL
ncbi:HMG box-containing protein 4 isoform X2 [Phlebotomus argentipes]|uniref:HMG box-containing protein 4 isoform X2 n=1 Tax=Phlebotomus argentipes TaxID=94469 RepID=UPI0028929CF2|nr:HMG box-containing protein 4 isoform X2 [Phlebotomus argentipes]